MFTVWLSQAFSHSLLNIPLCPMQSWPVHSRTSPHCSSNHGLKSVRSIIVGVCLCFILTVLHLILETWDLCSGNLLHSPWSSASELSTSAWDMPFVLSHPYGHHLSIHSSNISLGSLHLPGSVLDTGETKQSTIIALSLRVSIPVFKSKWF